MADIAAETVFLTWLKTAFPDVRVVTELPADLAGVLPVIRVSCFGGPGESVYTFTNPAMDFDCFAASRDAARSLAYAVRRRMRSELPGRTVAGVAVLRVNPGTEPNWAPWDNTSLRRFVYSTTARLHNPEA